jgi:hypothetical protein
MTATALQTDTAWLRISNYRLTALNQKLAGRLAELEFALNSGVPAFPDSNRDSFYDVELPNGWAYIHVRDDKRMVYLVAFSRN